MKNLNPLSVNELQDVNGGIAPAVAALIIAGIIVVGSAVASVYNGYQQSEEDCRETCNGGG